MPAAARARPRSCGRRSRRRLASAIQPPRDQYTYDGDTRSPDRSAWQEAVADANANANANANAMMIRARADPETIQYLMGWLTNQLPHPSAALKNNRPTCSVPESLPRSCPEPRARPHRPHLKAGWPAGGGMFGKRSFARHCVEGPDLSVARV
jgi:hypothetical protein